MLAGFNIIIIILKIKTKCYPLYKEKKTLSCTTTTLYIHRGKTNNMRNREDKTICVFQSETKSYTFGLKNPSKKEDNKPYAFSTQIAD